MKTKDDLNRNNKIPIKIGALGAILLLLFILPSCSKDKEKVNRIYNDPGYEIGTITSYISIPFRVSYKYVFTVEGKKYYGKEIAYGIGQDDDRLIGKSFLVVYNRSNVNESILNMHYFIQSEEDFIGLIKTFETAPPKP